MSAVHERSLCSCAAVNPLHRGGGGVTAKGRHRRRRGNKEKLWAQEW